MWSVQHVVYVSRFSGNDIRTCGTPLLPCRTISYAIDRATEGSCIYLDGTGTSKDPYSCQPLKPESSAGVYLGKSMSFVGIKSRAYISCLHDNEWFVDGIQHSYGLQVSFSGLAFHNTSLRFFDALVNVTDCLFTNSENLAMNFTVFNLATFDLNLNTVVFNENKLCISVKSNNGINIRIANSTFVQNGRDESSVSSLSTIFWLNSRESNTNVHLGNCTFKNNKFGKNGMIFVENKEGSANFTIAQFKMEENGHSSLKSRIPNGLFNIRSAQVVATMDFGFVYKTFGTLLTVEGRSSQVEISSIEVLEFYSHNVNGGVVNIVETTNAFVSIKYSSFLNGENLKHGGAVAVTAPTLKLVIQNSTFHNLSNDGCGGAVFVQSHKLRKTPNPTGDSVVELSIVNSSFADNVSGRGGAVCLLVENMIAHVVDTDMQFHTE